MSKRDVVLPHGWGSGAAIWDDLARPRDFLHG